MSQFAVAAASHLTSHETCHGKTPRQALAKQGDTCRRTHHRPSWLAVQKVPVGPHHSCAGQGLHLWGDPQRPPATQELGQSPRGARAQREHTVRLPTAQLLYQFAGSQTLSQGESPIKHTEER